MDDDNHRFMFTIAIYWAKSTHNTTLHRKTSDYFFSYTKRVKIFVVGQVGFNIWAELAIKNTFIPDNNNDTLVDFDYVAVDVHLWDLFHNKIHLEEVTVEQMKFNIHKNTTDSLFNFNYLIKCLF